MRRPRPFNHVPVYYSERQGRVEHGKQVPASLNGVFADGQRSRRKGRGLFSTMSIPMLLSVVIILLAVALLVLNI